jgi:hypothetical protein
MTEIAAYLVDTTDHRTVCSWLRTNEVDPNDIPLRSAILIEPDPDAGFGEWRIRYEVYLRDANGYRYTAEGTDTLATRAVSTRLAIDPPMQWLNPLTD